MDIRVGAGACLLMSMKFHRSDGCCTSISGEPLASYAVMPLLMTSEKLDRNKEPLSKMLGFWQKLKERVIQTEMSVLINCPRVFACLGSNALMYSEEFLHDLWLNPPTLDELVRLDGDIAMAGIVEIGETGLPTFSSYATLRARGMINYFLRAATRNHFDVLVDTSVTTYALGLIGLAAIVAEGPVKTVDVLKTASLLMYRMDRVGAKLDPSIELYEAPTDQHIDTATTIASAVLSEELVNPGALNTGSYGAFASPFFVPRELPRRVLSLLGQLN